MNEPKRKPGRPRKVESKGFSALCDDFRSKHPAEWEAMKLGPLEYGLKQMAKKLDG